MAHTDMLNKAQDIDFTDAEFRRAPWQRLLDLAETAPIFWSEKQRGWIVTKHADVKSGYADRRLSAARMHMFVRNCGPQVHDICPQALKYSRLLVTFLDAPDHIRIRTLFLKAFSNSVVENVRAYAVSLIEEIMERARAQPEFDFVHEVTHRFPMRVIQAILGVDDSQSGEFFELGEAIASIIATTQPSSEDLVRFEQATIRLNALLSELIADRERAPTSDLLSGLVHARDNLDRLSHDELLAACVAVITGGAGTTAHMLGVSLYEIAKSPQLTELIRTKPGSEKDIIAELLRYPGLVMGMVRIADEDFEWHGSHLKKGDIVFLMNMAGNIDPDVFPDAMTIDPERKSRDSLAFGPGFHHCIGNILAKMELEELTSRVFRSFDVEILEEELQFVQSFVFRGFERLRVRFTPLPTSGA